MRKILKLLPPEISLSLLLWRNYFRRLFRKTHFELIESDLVEKAKTHLEKKEPTSHFPPLTRRWEYFLSLIREKIKTLKTPKEVITFAQGGDINFDHRQAAVYQERKFSEYEAHLKTEFPHFLELISKMGDSPYSKKETLHHFKGRLVSNVFYYHLRYFLQCLTWVPSLSTICEIGGGYGALARLWMDNPHFSPKNYFIIDFPECLFFDEVFLKANLGKNRVVSLEEYTKNPSDGKIILCPIHSLHLLDAISFDLAINTGSMQEMTEEWVDFWMDWLDQRDVKYFYSLNYFAQPLENLEESSNTCSIHLSKRWKCRLKTSNPSFVKLQSNRNFAELIAEKMDVMESTESLQLRYDALKRQFLDQQTLLDCFDIARLSDNMHLIHDLIFRIKNEMKFIPKELLFLIKRAKKIQKESLPQAIPNELIDLEAELESIYAKSRKNVVCNAAGKSLVLN